MDPEKSGPLDDDLEPDFDAVVEGEDEVWFGADELARASSVDLSRDGLLRKAYSLADLEADAGRPRLDLGRLPSWPGGPDSGHGWGPALSRWIGGVAPGQRILIDAAGSGHGRTGFVLQLADGLALRAARLGETDPEPLTPVVVLAEDGREEAGRRRIARWTGHDARIFRHGRAGAVGLADTSEDAVDRAYDEAETALRGPLRPPAEFLRFAAAPARGEELVGLLVEQVTRFASTYASDARGVWPVLVVDGLRRHATGNSAEQLEGLVAALSEAAQREGWILIATDRGLGRALDPWFDARLELSRGPGEDPNVELHVAHNRGGPTGGRVGYAWSPGLGRFEPSGE